MLFDKEVVPLYLDSVHWKMNRISNPIKTLEK